MQLLSSTTWPTKTELWVVIKKTKVIVLTYIYIYEDDINGEYNTTVIFCSFYFSPSRTVASVLLLSECLI